MNIETLLSLGGLSAKQSALYRAILEMGTASIADLCRESGLHRPAVYRELPTLEARALITKRLRGKRTVYTAAAPDALIEQIESFKNTIDESVADIRAAYQKKSCRPRVHYFEGRDGIKQTFSDLLYVSKKNDIYYRYGSRQSNTDINKFRPVNYREVQAKKNLERFVITSDERAKNYKKDLNRLVKTVPHNLLFDDNIQIIIYADKISIVDFDSETGIIIEHQKLANFQRKLFKLLFERL